MPRLSKELQDCVSFAVFCQEHSIPPRDLANMVTFAREVFCSEERAQSGPEDYMAGMDEKNAYSARHAKRTEEFRKAFTDVALRYFAKVEWPGLCPYLVTAEGHGVHLPAIQTADA